MSYFPFSNFIKTLLNDPDASTARTTLGLGTLSTQNGTFSGTSSGTNTGDQIISDATITTTDITTNNFTTAKHGFVPKGTNVGNFLKDDGTWAAASGGSGNAVSATVDFGSNVSDIATVTVVAAWVGASTKLVVSPFAVATADHDPEDYALEQITAYATNIVNGVGFDIIATSKNGTFGQYVVHIIGV